MHLVFNGQCLYDNCLYGGGGIAERSRASVLDHSVIRRSADGISAGAERLSYSNVCVHE